MSRRGRGRKRLWSARSPLVDAKWKKSRLARSDSCPAPEAKAINGFTASDRLCEAVFDSPAVVIKKTDEVKPDDDALQLSDRESSASASGNNVSRRTAVLFKKKSRGRPPSSSSLKHSLAHSNGSHDPGSIADLSKCPALKRRRSVGANQSVESSAKRKRSSSTEETLFNGLDFTQGTHRYL